MKGIPFGILYNSFRDMSYDSNNGLIVNGGKIADFNISAISISVR
jgi:hypothetical protein